MESRGIPDPHGKAEIGVNGWLIGFSTIFYAIRIFVRISITKSLGLDDALAGIAYVSPTVLLTTTGWAALRNAC